MSEPAAVGRHMTDTGRLPLCSCPSPNPWLSLSRAFLLQRRDYDEYVFDISPSDLENYTLHGYFCTFAGRTAGHWSVTFPLENT